MALTNLQQEKQLEAVLEAPPKRYRLAETLALGLHQSDLESFLHAYYDGKTPENIGHASLVGRARRACNHPHVQKLVRIIRYHRLQTVTTAADQLRRMWASAATVDRNEIAEMRRIPCRCCYGIGHQQQETPAERREREKEHAAAGPPLPRPKGAPCPHGCSNTGWLMGDRALGFCLCLPPFDTMGGVGYSKRKRPHPECPECHGEGVPDMLVKDTRNMSDGARALLDGYDFKNGVPVLKLVSRADAEDRLAKSFGLYVEKNMNLNINMPSPDQAMPDDPEAAAEIYKQLISG